MHNFSSCSVYGSELRDLTVGIVSHIRVSSLCKEVYLKVIGMKSYTRLDKCFSWFLAILNSRPITFKRIDFGW